MVCGTTNHFSTFALVPVPEPTTTILLRLGLAALSRRVR